MAWFAVWIGCATPEPAPPPPEPAPAAPERVGKGAKGGKRGAEASDCCCELTGTDGRIQHQRLPKDQCAKRGPEAAFERAECVADAEC